ncbi:hypothetical protein NLI96_g5946 [Meripilus lineatus]|uniref:Uncharacterized protein n=1 Tax=Meripilus lineatus TaxID=2056292 RepID=A0AAD5V1Z3_9APHY|nr:hypothetical protein NLI96_g5946 [Physisporinus lineatus]
MAIYYYYNKHSNSNSCNSSSRGLSPYGNRRSDRGDSSNILLEGLPHYRREPIVPGKSPPPDVAPNPGRDTSSSTQWTTARTVPTQWQREQTREDYWLGQRDNRNGEIEHESDWRSQRRSGELRVEDASSSLQAIQQNLRRMQRELDADLDAEESQMPITQGTDDARRTMMTEPVVETVIKLRTDKRGREVREEHKRRAEALHRNGSNERNYDDERIEPKSTSQDRTQKAKRATENSDGMNRCPPHHNQNNSDLDEEAALQLHQQRNELKVEDRGLNYPTRELRNEVRMTYHTPRSSIPREVASGSVESLIWQECSHRVGPGLDGATRGDESDSQAVEKNKQQDFIDREISPAKRPDRGREYCPAIESNTGTGPNQGFGSSTVTRRLMLNGATWPPRSETSGPIEGISNPAVDLRTVAPDNPIAVHSGTLRSWPTIPRGATTLVLVEETQEEAMQDRGANGAITDSDRGTSRIHEILPPEISPDFFDGGGRLVAKLPVISNRIIHLTELPGMPKTGVCRDDLHLDIAKIPAPDVLNVEQVGRLAKGTNLTSHETRSCLIGSYQIPNQKGHSARSNGFEDQNKDIEIPNQEIDIPLPPPEPGDHPVQATPEETHQADIDLNIANSYLLEIAIVGNESSLHADVNLKPHESGTRQVNGYRRYMDMYTFENRSQKVTFSSKERNLLDKPPRVSSRSDSSRRSHRRDFQQNRELTRTVLVPNTVPIPPRSAEKTNAGVGSEKFAVFEEVVAVAGLKDKSEIARDRHTHQRKETDSGVGSGGTRVGTLRALAIGPR